MPKVTFRTNLGSIDAKRLDLDHRKCQVGETLDVDKGVAEELAKMGVAVTADKAEDDELIQSAHEQKELEKEFKSAESIHSARERGELKTPAKEPDVKGVK